MDLVIQEIDGKSYYCRSQSNQSLLVEEQLSKMYISKRCKDLSAMITTSGTAAIRLVMEKLVKIIDKNVTSPINVFYGDELYYPTLGIIKYLARSYPFKFTSFNVNDTEHLLNMITEHKDD